MIPQQQPGAPLPIASGPGQSFPFPHAFTPPTYVQHLPPSPFRSAGLPYHPHPAMHSVGYGFPAAAQPPAFLHDENHVRQSVHHSFSHNGFSHRDSSLFPHSIRNAVNGAMDDGEYLDGIGPPFGEPQNGVVRRKQARKAVYKCLRDIVDREHLKEPEETKVEDIIGKLRSEQQGETPQEGEADFIDADWVRALWGKTKQELLKEVQSNGHQNGHLLLNGALSPLDRTQQQNNGSDPTLLRPYHVAGAAIEDPASSATIGRRPTSHDWVTGSKIEAQDSEGAWYRAEVMATSFTRKQVLVKFAGWDDKWNEWIHVDSGRVREILNPEAKRIRKDGTPIVFKRQKTQGENGAGEDEVEKEDVKEPVLSREDARLLDRMRRQEEAAKAKEAKLKRKENKEEKKQSALQLFLQEEILRLRSTDVTISIGEARKLANKAWKEQQAAGKPSKADGLGMEMGMIVGSVHQLYVCNDEETPEMVATKLGVDVKRLVQMNGAVYPHLQANKKLMQGTMLKLPGRTGSGGKAEITVFAKVQGSKTLVLNMRECDKVKALKRRVHNMEGIPIKEMAVLFAGQKLDEEATLSDYNVRMHSSVNVQVGSTVFNDAAAAEIEEIEYDSGWMQSPAGQNFLTSEDGEKWLKTTAGKLWAQEVKAQKKKENSLKSPGDGGGRMSAYNMFIKTEVSKMRALHPTMHHRTAWQRVTQLWRMHESPEAQRHRAEWGKTPSVVTWNFLNVNKTSNHHPSQDAASSGSGVGERAAGDGGNGGWKKRKHDGASDVNPLVGEQFNSTYDWSYREHKLSRTAKKAARISLTTDTLEMLTCELVGNDDRYDGSGWTTFRKPVAPAKAKLPRKPKADGDSRKRKAGEDAGEGKGKEKKEHGVPRWYRGVPRCPDLQVEREHDHVVQPADVCFATDASASKEVHAVSAGGVARSAEAHMQVSMDDGDKLQHSMPLESGEAANAEHCAAEGGGAGEAGADEDWLPLPTGLQDGDVPEMFRLPYPQARELLKMEFEDAVCADDTSEFPTPFVAIKRNKYVHEKQVQLEEEEDGNKCQCIFVPGMPETACGALSNCMLRDLFIECTRKRCPCGKYCLNQRLQRSQWAKCSIFKASNGRGWCLRTDEELSPGQLAVEYIGEVVSGEEVQRRASAYLGKRHTYLLKLNQEEFIDSTRMANLARFINHCCEPNCEMQKWHVGQEQRVGLFAKYRIPAGSELTFDYDMEFFGSEDIKCLCGAPKCRGTLGRPKEEAAKPQANDFAFSGRRAAREAAERLQAQQKKIDIQRAARGAIEKAKQVRKARGRGAVASGDRHGEQSASHFRKDDERPSSVDGGHPGKRKGRPPKAKPPPATDQQAVAAEGSQSGGGRRRGGMVDESDRILAKVLALSEMESSGASPDATGGDADPFGLMSPAERRQQEAALKVIAKMQNKPVGK